MTNRLASATSPYLRQHAENPVDWWEWGAPAFEEARRRDVPIFLSIGYASCHWCHVMAHESFEDAEVAARLADGYVAIKVDREERPDVDAVHMAACQAMTGQGGWPLTVLLTPDGRPFHAGTYYPRAQVLELLTEATGAWTHHRPDAERFADRLTDALVSGLGGEADAPDAAPGEAAATDATVTAPSPTPASAARPLSDDDLRTALGALTRDFDQEHPGFGTAPKFPPAASLVHLVRHHERTGERWADAMSQRIGDAMARGGIHDQLGGGFARYSVDRAWVVPHFEKMLYDNAQLLRAYALLWRSSRLPVFERAARGIVEFLRRDLRTPQGALASALDADTVVDGRGREGATYLWTLRGLDEVLGIRDGRFAAEVFHVHPEGNAGLEEPGACVLQLPRDPAEVVRTVLAAHPEAPVPDAAREDPAAWFEDVRARLLAARAQRPQPARDDKVVTAWNGLAITALAEAGTILGEPSWIEDAAAIADHVLDVHHADGRWRRASMDGVAGLADATSEDLGDLAEGLLALHEASGDGARLEQARGVLDDALAVYAVSESAPGHGGFYDVPAQLADGVPLLVRPRSLIDLAEPCGTTALAGALWRFSRQAGPQDADAPRFAAAARRALHAVARHAVTTPRFAGWALATAESMAAEAADQAPAAEAVRR